MYRREFIVGAVCLASGLGIKRSTSTAQIAPCGDDNCRADLICQWNNAFDDDREIDDSEAGSPIQEITVWGGHPGINPDELKSPLAALGYFLRGRLLGDNDDKETAYKILGFGQFHKLRDKDHPEQYYRRCVGNEDDFWFCLTGLSDTGANLGFADFSLAWQVDNNRGSLERYFVLWCAQRRNPNRLLQMLAIYFLCLGQRHHDGRPAVKAYRSCFREQPEQLFVTVANRLGIDPNACN